MTDETEASTPEAEPPAPEVRPSMATKGEGWSGREDEARASTPEPPHAGPGTAPREGEERFGRAEVDERYKDLEDPLNEIPDDVKVDAAKIFKESRVEEVLADMDRQLVALSEVKGRVREIASLLLVDRLRRSIGLEAEPPTLHMSFTGNPGTGKTTVAAQMGQILYKLGFIRKGHLVSVTRDDLVGQYVGHTAPKTREVLKRAMGGVLFIDEAYHIYRVDNERDYGQETVEMLLQVMENERANIVVIMAGYKDHMDRFFGDVPGLSSRIAHHIDFPDYSIEELMEITRMMATEQRYRFSEGAEEAFQDYLKLRMDQPRFANGRSARNALDRARMRQAIRLYDQAQGKELMKKDLVTIEPDDILKSRVFEGGYYQEAAGPTGEDG